MYVHFPWCLKKCPYCDFLSVAEPETANIPHQAYADQVLRELDWRLAAGLPPGGQPPGAALELRSVFFGGGTPSLWDSAALGRVLRAILERLPWREPPEITVECNPTSLDLERANRLADVGVNRLSLGVQGLEDARLKFLGRLHDGALGLQAVADAVASRVPRVSADLIFGVHQQSPEAARAEVARLGELGVEHLSAYALTIEPGTHFGALARKGRLPLLAEESVADSFLLVEQALSERGFEHYEISNYARPGARSQHNLGYWRGAQYLGLGTGAWGTVRVPEGVDTGHTVSVADGVGEARGAVRVPDGVAEGHTVSVADGAGEARGAGRLMRYRNTPSPERYLRADFSQLALGCISEAVSELEELSPETQVSERLMLGLRLAEGVDLEQVEAETGAQVLTAERRRAVERQLDRGGLEWLEGGRRLRIPRAAWLQADAVIADVM